MLQVDVAELEFVDACDSSATGDVVGDRVAAEQRARPTSEVRRQCVGVVLGVGRGRGGHRGPGQIGGRRRPLIALRRRPDRGSSPRRRRPTRRDTAARLAPQRPPWRRLEERRLGFALLDVGGVVGFLVGQRGLVENFVDLGCSPRRARRRCCWTGGEVSACRVVTDLFEFFGGRLGGGVADVGVGVWVTSVSAGQLGDRDGVELPRRRRRRPPTAVLRSFRSLPQLRDRYRSCAAVAVFWSCHRVLPLGWRAAGRHRVHRSEQRGSVGFAIEFPQNKTFSQCRWADVHGIDRQRSHARLRDARAGHDLWSLFGTHLFDSLGQQWSS